MNKTFDPQKPFRTRAGYKAEFLRVLKGDTEYPLLVVVTNVNGGEEAQVFRAGGNAYKSGESDFDLINIPEKVKVSGKLIVYRDGSGSFSGKRLIFAGSTEPFTPIACIEINQEVEVGQGLETKEWK